MKRAPFFLSLAAVAIGWAAPGCSGDEFTATSGDDGPADAGEPSGGRGGASGSGTGGSDSGGEPSGGSGGSSSGGSSTGGDAGETSGGTGNGGTTNGGTGNGGVSGIPSGGTGGGGVSGNAGRAGSGGSGGTFGSSGSGGAGAGGTAGSGATAGKGGTGGTAGTAGSGGTAGRGGTAGSGGTAGTAGSGGTTNGACPLMPPVVGSNCATSDYCAYGTHPLDSCRQIMDCLQGHWQETQAACGAPPSCSVSMMPPVVGGMCSDDGFQCRADQNVFCMCASNCTTVCTSPIWHCFGPPPGCPSLMPNHGQPCSGTATCSYGTCSSQTAIDVSCENGTYRWRDANCPQ